MARLNELGGVVVDGVAGDTSERNAVARSHLPTGENYVAYGGDDLTSVIEGLVKIAETEEDDGIGRLLLDAKVQLLKRGHC
jgi:hypothetical protein